MGKLTTIWLFTALFVGLASIVSNSQTTDETTTASTPDLCPDYCELKPDAGSRGKAPFRLWYYNFETKECKRFAYSGRRGNKNRFRNKALCESECSGCSSQTNLSQNDVCSLPVDPGRCNSTTITPSIAWFFDPKTDTCQVFAYTGCAGNENRFDSEEVCQKACNESDA